MSVSRNYLEYFSVDGAVGGNQEWFRNVVMYMGGCAAVTACDCCIYFALRNSWDCLYPFDVEHLNQEDYIRFGMEMKPYLKPRVGGVKKLSMFIEGFGNYLRDRMGGDIPFRMKGFSGKHTIREAVEAIKKQIDAGFPVPYLMLRHKNTEYKDFVWHWFVCYGYEETEVDFLITVATYGEAATFSLAELWDTGCEEKGGLILFEK